MQQDEFMLKKNKILKIAEEQGKVKTSVLVEDFDVSRQFAHGLIRELVENGDLVKIGKTRGTYYVLPGQEPKEKKTKLNKRLKNENLEEYEVYNDIKESLPLLKHLSDNVESILSYAFSEMLNNAIEHSESKYIEIEVGKKEENLYFTVKDFGIGVFKNVMKKHNLNSEIAAIQDLLKGKTTTQPKAHSGEGIFFTSKVADVFVLKSFDHALRIDNNINDVFIEEVKPSKKGTIVNFFIDVNSEKHLSEVFREYQTDADAKAFDKTEIRIKLYTRGTVYVSRSQARRLLAGLDKFKSVILDFDQVPTIGQAFADEVFRVFKDRHPEIDLVPVNMNDAVEFMVKRAQQTER